MMKITKKIISALLILSMLTGLLALSSCGTAKAESITTGEFTNLIVDKFGIESYQSEEPHISSVGKDNTYFDSVQGAYEWKIITDEDDFSTDIQLTKEYCAVMLARAVGFDDLEGKSNEEVANLSAEKGYITYQYKGHKDSKKVIDKSVALESLDAAFNAFANHDFGTPVEEVTYNDDVVVVGENQGYTGDGSSFVLNEDSGINNDSDIKIDDNDATIQNSSGQKENSDKSSSKDKKNKTASSSEKIFYPAENTVAIPEALAAGIKEGTSYVVPSSDGVTKVAYKAEKVEYQDGYAYIKNAEGGSFEEVVSELKASGSFKPDLTAGTVTDGLGNVIGSGELSASDTSNTFNTSTQYLSKNTTNCGKQNFSLDFKSGDLKITGKVTPDSVSFSISGTIWKNSDGAKATLSKSYEIKNIQTSYDVDYSWFKLHSAYAQVKYDTVDTTSGKFEYKKEADLAPDYTNGNGKFLTNLKRSHFKDSNDKGAKSIKICSVPLLSAYGVVSLNLDVKIKISVSGEITLTVTTSNTKGIRFKEGSGVEFIKEENKDKDLTLKAKAEATLYLGLGLYGFGFNVVGCGIEGGIGLEASIIIHLADENNREIDSISVENQDGGQCESLFSSLNGMTYEHINYGTINLHTDICYEVTTYWILKFSLDTDSLLSKFTSIKASYEIFNKKNATIKELSGHWENGKKVGECTRKYDGSVEEETTESETILNNSRYLQIDLSFISLEVGEKGKINVESIPNGYSASNIKYSSSDNKIATVDSNGNITGVGDGRARIIVQTDDGKCSAYCTVLVSAKASSTFETLPSKKYIT